jgi:hypothetical protein
VGFIADFGSESAGRNRARGACVAVDRIVAGPGRTFAAINRITSCPVPSAPSLPSAPALPGLGKGGPSVPSVEISAKVDVAGQSHSANINTATLANSIPSAPSLPSTSAGTGSKNSKSASAGPKAPGAPDVGKSAKAPKTGSMTKTAKAPGLNQSSPVSSKQTKAISKATKANLPSSAEQEAANLNGTVAFAKSNASSEVTSAEQTASKGGAPSVPSSKSIHQTIGHDELAASVLGGLAAHETQGYVNQQVGPITGGNPGSSIPSAPADVGPHNAD